MADLAERYWTLGLRAAPLMWVGESGGGPLSATTIGDHRFDAELDDLSAAGRARTLDELAKLEAEARAMNANDLKDEDRLSLSLLLDQLESVKRVQACDAERWVVDQLGGPQVALPVTVLYYPLGTEKGVRDLIARYRKAGRYFDQQIASLREGLAKREVSPRRNIELVIEQLDNLLKKDAQHSDFLPAPEKLAPKTRLNDLASVSAAVEAEVLPALRRYRAFLHDELLPRARTEPGLAALPIGDACYRATIRIHTGLDLSPAELHALGEKLVAEIEAEESAIALAEGAPKKPDGKPDLKAFEKQLAARADQKLSTAASLLDWTRGTMARAMKALPTDFKTLPQRPIEVKSVEPFRSASSPGAFYNQAPDDGLQPAYYYVNTDHPEEHLLYDAESIVFHEAVPGHHLQVSIGQSLTGLPAFRRNGGSTAYVEGWALYSERLADELGLYSNRLARYGMLGEQALRAARLVVDTGLHTLHWSREQALAYFLEHTTDEPGDSGVEIDRYIIWPGQALGYMVGEQEILKLRAEARERLGARFDLREFHDAVLRHGALPLPVLDQEVRRWVASK
jgi:uncharacterized protein (DUF885 family)